MKRTAGVAAATGILLISGCAASPAETPQGSDLPDSILSIMEQPVYEEGVWGLSVVDVETGDVVLTLNPDEKFLTGSTAKILSVTAALEVLGADATFTTPVVAVGEVTEGTLHGDLVLRGSGDLTLGGRTMADGTIEVPIFDHYDANALPGLATLSSQDPLAGLNELAQQVAAAGIDRVDGEVLVDDRLWDPVIVDDVPISPIVVNDNLVDLVLTPAPTVGDAATLEWLPQTAAYDVETTVTTGSADSGIDITITEDPEGTLVATGSVPLGAEPVVQTFQVEDPAIWARTLFIEALERAGIEVAADVVTASAASLPETAVLDAATPIAEFTSPPFSETARLINKVSHNLGANQLPLLLAVDAGERTLEAGLTIELGVLEAAGVDAGDVDITDGQGLEGNRITPAAMTTYLRHLTTTSTFQTFYDSTPILGVDGSLATVLPEGDPAIGMAHAKTGTLVAEGTSSAFVLETKALAGFVETAAGRNLAFAVFVNDVPVDDISAIFQANNDLGAIASQLYQLY
ncbi:D-alanyl-D-alanine carboxypeptidase/D-alanyl-D-alanine-endopeptidase [Microbacterium sp. R86528]|uniref:D-alanyl-D-alanine carboxypeptidase/D-alanyl-D-alanine endopeptidase n=1 Tax=Microbacterium sp. R86528 TaxID=3093864 RepID=UPI0037CAE78B